MLIMGYLSELFEEGVKAHKERNILQNATH